MKTLLIMLALYSIQYVAAAQKTIDPDVKYYSWIFLNNSPNPVKGVILETTDSTIKFILKEQLIKNKAVAPYNAQSIPVTSIDKIKIRKRNAATHGFLWGALIGAATGAVVGYVGGDDECGDNWCILLFSAEEKAAMGAVTGIIPGGLLGTILGARRKTIYINADQTLYTNSRWELDTYALTKL